MNSWRRDDISQPRSRLFASGSICAVCIQDEFVAPGDHNEANFLEEMLPVYRWFLDICPQRYLLSFLFSFP